LSRADSRRFQIVIHVTSLDHLRDVNGHSIKQLSRLGVSVHSLLAEGGDSCGALEKLGRQKDEQYKDSDADDELGQRKAA
jgi:hypothetical protein